MPAVLTLAIDRWRAEAMPALDDEAHRHHAVTLTGALTPAECRAAVEAVQRARADWVADFGGEQFTLGRAFYTHFETGGAAAYFAEAAASDARVERHLPGMQARVRTLLGQLVGGRVRARLGFAGPAVHVFPAGEKVARVGGVPHWDVEGLPPLARARGDRALTLVLVLQPPASGGGLRLWDACFDGADEPDEAALARPGHTHHYRPGEILLASSYRLHQIMPFGGDLDRISITVHAVEIDHGVWDTWF